MLRFIRMHIQMDIQTFILYSFSYLYKMLHNLIHISGINIYSLLLSSQKNQIDFSSVLSESDFVNEVPNCFIISTIAVGASISILSNFLLNFFIVLRFVLSLKIH